MKVERPRARLSAAPTRLSPPLSYLYEPDPAVLRAGAFELDKRRDIPARVVVSEYVAVANAFVDRSETGMVNAVLDVLARRLRTTEFRTDAGN